MEVNDLLGELGAVSYDGPVTDGDFWKRVADRLVLRRREKGLKSPNAAAALPNAPTQKTIEQIESGNIGRVDKLAEYAQALNLTVVDLFRSALGDVRETTPELEEIIRKYYVTDTDGRRALHSVAVALPVRARGPDQGTPDGPPETPPETSRGGNAAAKRRGAK